jgi:CubicO group peptidase (beta-lactamase class C family)
LGGVSRTGLLACLVVLLVACAAASPPTPAPTLTAAPTPSHAPTAAPAPTVAPTATALAPSPTAVAAASERLRARLTQAAAEGFTGAALVARGDEVLLREAHGQADAERGVPNTPATRFRIASLTKQFTAGAVLVLQRDGKLDVSGPFCNHLDDCPAAWRPVTLHHLLTHTSGIPEYLTPNLIRTSGQPRTVSELLAVVRDSPLDFAPGSRFAYSNSGYVLLGQVIERVSGQPYDRFLRAAVLDPLGMKDTGYLDADAPPDGLAAGYVRLGDRIARVSLQHPTNARAAGALYSTADDLHRWSQALDGDAFLPRPLREAMFHPERAGDIGGTPIDGYGYGWAISQVAGRRAASHSGGGVGGHAAVWKVSDGQVFVAVLSNAYGDVSEGGRPAYRLGRELAEIALG